MVLPRLSPEVAAMRRRLRHIHIPEIPPLYAPRSLAPKIRDFIQNQITQMRSAFDSDTKQSSDAAGNSTNDVSQPFSRPQSSFHSWLKKAGPPPTILSFTCRPTYVLPEDQVQKAEPWQAQYLTNALKGKMPVKFPEPPGWSPLPWRPSFEQVQSKTGSEFDPLSYIWPEAGQISMPCAETMYLGPGQVSIWPIIDLRDEVQRGNERLNTKYDYERLLEDTTVEVLRREYGLEAFAIPGSSGVWVESKLPPPEIEFGQVERDASPRTETVRENVRRIATIHADITEDITQWGVSIHVGQPDPMVDSWTTSTNPWMPIRQHKTTTSVVAELAHIGSSPRYASRTRQLELWSKRKSRYLRTYFNKEGPFAGTLYQSMPYSLIKIQSGRREPAPLGMDNRDLSTAWTYEFARQLGMHDGFVDHYGTVDVPEDNSTALPTKSPKPGFMVRSLLDEHRLTIPYDQVNVPSVQAGENELASSAVIEDTLRLVANDGKIDPKRHDGWMLSWPLWYDTLTKRLDESIAGRTWDTRLRAYEWERQQEARKMRRKMALREAEQSEQRWGAETKQLIRRPIIDQISQEQTVRTAEKPQLLEGAPALGRKLQKLLIGNEEISLLIEEMGLQNENEPMNKQSRPLRRQRPEYVKFTETRPEQFRREKRQRGLENAAERRKAQPHAVTTRPTRPDGKPSYLPKTQQL